jgi:putative ABC transport system substrate-binding protein
LPTIGFLSSSSPGPANPSPFIVAIGEGLREAGYVDGQNVAIEYRWAEGNYDRLPSLAADLIARNVKLIMTGGGNMPAIAARNATSTTTVVFVSGDDPVKTGLIASLSRPGGNITGVSFLTNELTAKRLELLLALTGQGETVALMVNPTSSAADRVVQDALEAARAKKIRLQVLKAAIENEIEAGFAALSEMRVAGVLLEGDPFFTSQRKQIVALAARFAIPTSYAVREFVTAGGLISYGPSLLASYRQVGAYAGRILKGENPADLPVQQPITIELVINLRTAKALGLSVPQSILGQAEVIE